MSDARFEDGGETPLRLIARDGADLQVLSALCQDAEECVAYWEEGQAPPGEENIGVCAIPA